MLSRRGPVRSNSDSIACRRRYEIIMILWTIPKTVNKSPQKGIHCGIFVDQYNNTDELYHHLVPQ